MTRQRDSTLATFEKKLRKDILRLRVRGAARQEIKAILKRTEREVQNVFKGVYHRSK